MKKEIFNKNNLILLSVLALFTLPFACFKHAYIYINFTFWLGILFAPFIFRIDEVEKSRKYFIPAIALGILLLFGMVLVVFQIIMVFMLNCMEMLFLFQSSLLISMELYIMAKPLCSSGILLQKLTTVTSLLSAAVMDKNLKRLNILIQRETQ